MTADPDMLPEYDNSVPWISSRLSSASAIDWLTDDAHKLQSQSFSEFPTVRVQFVI